ncbi:MAG: YybS family protein [Clostridia bacterium]|nr:YybS family protein [Clostridia bacterium]
MNINKNTKGLVEAAVLTAVICVLAIAGMYIPLLGMVLFIVPTPLIILGKKYGVKYSFLSLVASSLVIMSFSSPAIALFVVAFPGVMAVVIGIFMHKKRKHAVVIAAGTITSIIATVLSISLATQLMGISFVENIQEMLKQSADIQEYMFSLTNADKETIEKSNKMMNEMQELVLFMIPSAIIVSAFISSVINYFLSLSILRRTGYSIEPVTPFKYFRLSRNTMNGLLVIMVLSLIVVQLNIVDQDTLMANLFFLYQLVFIIQGLAVLVYYLSYYKINKIFMVLIGVFLAMSRVGMNLLFVVGIIDMFLDLRKYKSENESNY